MLRLLLWNCYIQQHSRSFHVGESCFQGDERHWKVVSFLLSTTWDSGCNLTTEFHVWVEVSGVLHQVHFGFEDSHKGDWTFNNFHQKSVAVYRFCVKKLIWIVRVESLCCPWSHVSNALPSIETRSNWSPIIFCIPTFSVFEDWIPLAAAFQPIRIQSLLLFPLCPTLTSSCFGCSYLLFWATTLSSDWLGCMVMGVSH